MDAHDIVPGQTITLASGETFTIKRLAPGDRYDTFKVYPEDPSADLPPFIELHRDDQVTLAPVALPDKVISGLNDDHLHVLLDALNSYSGDQRMLAMNVHSYASNGDDSDPKATEAGTIRLGREAVAVIEAALARRS